MMKNVVDLCDTSLVLGLGYAEKIDVRPSDLHLRPPLEPSLTLRPLISDAYGSTSMRAVDTKFSPVATLPRQQSSSNSTVSSFSKAESEGAERASSRAREEEEEGSARKKLRLTKEQSALLEERFKKHSTLNPKQKQALAKQLNLRPRQVEVWFQNRRARTKMKQTEVDCEFLKRCCETLTDENRRLQKELQDLRDIQLSSPWFMQFPGATLSVCPACKRPAGAGGAFPAAAPPPGKSLLFNHFTHSAAG